jgi:hypothetical protein
MTVSSPRIAQVFEVFEPMAKNLAIDEALTNSLEPHKTQPRHHREEDSEVATVESLYGQAMPYSYTNDPAFKGVHVKR